MKKTRKILLLLATMLLLFSSLCFATDNTSLPTAGQDKTNGKDSSPITVLNNDLYLNAKNLLIKEAVNGNVFAFGTSVTVTGQIMGDLFVVANQLVIEEDATVAGNVFIFAPSTTIKGEVYDVYALSSNFELTSTASIYRDLKVYSGTVAIDGIVKKDAYILTNAITMPEAAKDLIGGNLHYTSPQESKIPDGAVIGEVKYTVYTQPTKTAQQIITSYITKFVSTILYAVVVILLATFFGSKFTEKSNYNLMKRPFITAGIGILAIVLIPVLAIFFMVSGLLTYIGIAMLAIYGLILSITLPLLSMAIAKSVEKKLKNPSKVKFIVSSIIVAIGLWVVQLIPYIGSYASIFIYVMGLGVFLFSIFSKKDGTETQKK